VSLPCCPSGHVVHPVCFPSAHAVHPVNQSSGPPGHPSPLTPSPLSHVSRLPSPDPRSPPLLYPKACTGNSQHSRLSFRHLCKHAHTHDVGGARQGFPQTRPSGEVERSLRLCIPADPLVYMTLIQLMSPAGKSRNGPSRSEGSSDMDITVTP
jgi:hypothetical protein